MSAQTTTRTTCSLPPRSSGGPIYARPPNEAIKALRVLLKLCCIQNRKTCLRYPRTVGALDGQLTNDWHELTGIGFRRCLRCAAVTLQTATVPYGPKVSPVTPCALLSVAAMACLTMGAHVARRWYRRRSAARQAADERRLQAMRTRLHRRARGRIFDRVD